MRKRTDTARATWILLGAIALMVFAGIRCTDRVEAMGTGGNNNDVTVTTSAVGGGMTITIPSTGHSLQNLTLSQSATIVIDKGHWVGQFLILNVCQDGTGGWTPTIGHVVGLTLKGGFPTFTTTASKCDIVGLQYTSSGVFQVTGYAQNE